MSLVSPSLTIPRARQSAGSTFRSLGVRNYRLFFMGQLVSLTGTGMQTVAQGWLVLSLTGSGVALGVTVALQFLPLLLFGLWGGLIADRFDKRRTLVLTQTVPALLALGMFALVATGAVALWMVFVMAFLQGLVIMVDLPTRQSFVVEMVGPEQLPNAVGLNSAMFNMGRMLGPVLAGVVIASAGIAPAFLANAVSYVAVTAALLAMRPSELFAQERAARARREIRAGLRYMWTTPALRATLVLMAVVGTFGFNFVVILPLLARFALGGGPRLYGLLSGAMALGSLAGALLAARRRGPTRAMLLRSVTAFGGLTVAAAMAPGAALVGLALVGVGLAVMLFLATVNTTLQLATVGSMRGRVMAVYGLLLLGSAPVGAPLVGWIASQWGARVGVAFGGVVTLAAALGAWRSRAWTR